MQLAGGQEGVSDFFLGADSKIRDVADAAGCQLAVASSRCVLLSPTGECMAHSLTASATNLADCDVITVLVMDLPRVFAHPAGRAFAAVKHNGSGVTWGDAVYGGNSNKVNSELTGGVDRVVGTEYAFAAVKQDGSVVTWGAAGRGGNSDEVRDQLTGGVDNVVGNVGAFAAVKQDGSVVTWGHAASGGNSDEVRDQLTGGVRDVFGNHRAFAALKQDGSVVMWDSTAHGGESGSVKDQKQWCFCRREARRLCGHVGIRRS